MAKKHRRSLHDKHLDIEKREFALRQIAYSESKLAHIDLLFVLMDPDEDPYFRSFAAEYIAMHGTEAYLPHLLWLLAQEHLHSYIAFWCIHAVSRLEDRNRVTTRMLLKNYLSDNRIVAIAEGVKSTVSDEAEWAIKYLAGDVQAEPEWMGKYRASL